MRFLKVLCVLALAVAVTGLVYAETQSVKISGDLAIRGILRGDYDLDRNHQEGTSTQNTTPVVRSGNQDDWQTYFMSTAEVQIDADLTDNVSTVIRLFNQRDWDVRAKSISGEPIGGSHFTPVNGTAGYTANNDEFDLGVNLAYVELKEFLYSPLTLKIGRQDLWFGKGFIVGRNQRDYNNTINAEEYTSMNSFDSIRATLDYDPWTIDAIGAKIWENDIQTKDDVDLWGLNVGYIFDVYNAEMETYYFLKDDRSLETWNVKQHNTVNTIGLRGSLDPIENWTVGAESAFQYGWYVGSRDQHEKRKRSAFAIDASVECRHFQQQYAWKPKLGAEYIYYSGHKEMDEYAGGNPAYTTGSYTGWDIMYRGKFDSAIREFLGLYYLTNQDVNNGRADIYPSYPDASSSNQHQVIVIGSIQPTDSLTLDMRYLNFWQQYQTYHVDSSRSTGSGSPHFVKDNRYLGGEIDVEATWDYTEDVSFGMLAAWFFPGSHYYDQSNDVATDVVGTVKVSF